MKKTVFFILALGLAATAQTSIPMVGLPDVELSGNAETPIVTNHSGKRIIALDMRFDFADGSNTGGTTTFMHRAGFAPGSSQIFPGVVQKGAAQTPGKTELTKGLKRTSGIQITSADPVVKVVVDSVAFEDLEFIGPDVQHSFDGLALFIGDFREMGKSILNGSKTWGDIAILAMSSKTPRHNEDSVHMRQRWVAEELNHEWTTAGEVEARDLARRYSELPELWKGNLK